MSQKYETPYFGGGGYAFLDATYAELTIGFSGGSGKYKETSTYEQPGQPTQSDVDVEYSSIRNFSIGLLGKYPIAINPKLSVFPLLGKDYLICTAAKIADEDYEGFPDDTGKRSDDSGDLSALWFKFGGGLDYSFSDKIYLRLEALYGIRLANKFEKDTKDYFEKQYENAPPGVDVDIKTLLGHGITAKLAIGYKF
jgi:opacity protein-like surface antigen